MSRLPKRMVSAHTYPGEGKDAVLDAISRGENFDILVTDPLVLGSGPFDIQDLDDTLIVKLTDSTKRGWMIFIERVGDELRANDPG